MDCRQGEGVVCGDDVKDQCGNSRDTISENRSPRSSGQAFWATEPGVSKSEIPIGTNRDPHYEERLLLGCEPPTKRSRNLILRDLSVSDRPKAIADVIYRTKPCFSFQRGTCPYIRGCDFAHAIEELRKPPPHWQEKVAPHEKEQFAASEPREEFQIPVLEVSNEMQGKLQGEQQCKLFCTGDGCPYGCNCTFLHGEQTEVRKSEAICLVSGDGGNSWNSGNKSSFKNNKWKTRICNEWKIKGYCRFGLICRFAHGATELRPDYRVLDSNVSSVRDTNQGKGPAKNLGVSGGSSRRLSSVIIQKPGEKSPRRWKGPNKISKIYGDWIDDL